MIDKKEASLPERVLLSDLTKKELLVLVKTKNRKIRELKDIIKSKDSRIRELSESVQDINKKYNQTMDLLNR